MTKYRKRILSLLLTASMVFTMNSFVFGDEITADGAVAEGAAIEELAAAGVATDTGYQPANTGYQPTTPAITVSADLTLSENIAAVSDNFYTETSEPIKGTTYTYIIAYDNAVGYAGLPIAWSGAKQVSKGKATGVDVQVFYAETSKLPATVSGADAISINASGKAEVSPNSVWKKASIKKVTIKSTKGATVDITGKGTVVAKKATYISAIKFDDKTLNKDVKKALKTALSAPKKEKTKKISANGIAVGDSWDAKLLTIAVFPAYAGNDEEALKVVADYSKYIKVFKANGTLKYKNGVPKKIVGTIGSKKVTLKPTKKTAKPLGFVNKAETTSTTVANPKGKNYVVGDGSFFGNFYYTAS